MISIVFERRTMSFPEMLVTIIPVIFMIALVILMIAMIVDAISDRIHHGRRRRNRGRHLHTNH